MPPGVPRIPAAWEYAKLKRCSVCGDPKPWADFSPRKYWPDGQVRTVATRCHDCHAKLNRERKYAAAWRARDPERSAAKKREWYERRRAQLRREASGKDSPLPTAPLRTLLERAYAERAEIDPAYTLARFAEECGVSERMIRRIDREQERTAMRVVDTICTRLGVPMWELYPELLDDERSAA